MEVLQQVEPESFEAVREFIRDELCEKNQLERDAFEMAQRVLTRNGQPCGFYFCIYGPRSVRLTAVWDLNTGSIFFYDSLGRRVAICPAPLERA
jgi:hypothetical protein